MLIPNSSAMDATSTCGGPITMLPQIVTGEPEQIWAHVEQLVQKAAQFAAVLQQFEQAQQQLDKAWFGGASESAIKKIGDSLQAFEKIIKAVEEGAALLGISAGMVKSAQTGYQSVVSAVNPTVAGLMSNPWTYSAAVALSTGTSATLRGFIQMVQGLLTALGAGKLAMQISTLISIISEIEQLMSSGTGTSAGSTPPTTPSAPVIAPAPPNVVSPIGSTGTPGAPGSVPGATPSSPTGTPGAYPAPAAAGAYASGGYPAAPAAAGGYPTPPAAGGYPAPAASGGYPSSGYPAGNYPDAGTGYPAVGGGMPIAPGGYPNAGTAAMPGDPANSWIPVDPPASSAAADPVVVTVNEHGVATTVDVPAGHDVGVKIGGDGHLDVNVDGQPSDASAAPAHTAAHTGAHPAAHPHPAAQPHAAAPAHPTAAAHHPAAPKPAAHDVVVTVADHDVKTTIDVPAGDELKIDIEGNRVTEHLTARP